MADLKERRVCAFRVLTASKFSCGLRAVADNLLIFCRRCCISSRGSPRNNRLRIERRPPREYLADGILFMPAAGTRIFYDYCILG
jgi:hypothetical protein